MWQIINLSPTLNEHTDKDFRNENFIVNMACLKGGLPVSPYMDQWRIQTLREGAGVGGGGGVGMLPGLKKYGL